MCCQPQHIEVRHSLSHLVVGEVFVHETSVSHHPQLVKAGRCNLHIFYGKSGSCSYIGEMGRVILTPPTPVVNAGLKRLSNSFWAFS